MVLFVLDWCPVNFVDVDFFIADPTVCTEVLADPHLSDCGHHLCGNCRDRLLAGNKAECPECREPDILKSARLNKHLQRQVKDLVVYCSHHEEGCKWKGELRNLGEHLDPVKRRCGYVRVPCSFQCGELVRSGAVKEHKRSHCRKRPYTCKYCGYHNTLDVVTERHSSPWTARTTAKRTD